MAMRHHRRGYSPSRTSQHSAHGGACLIFGRSPHAGACLLWALTPCGCRARLVAQHFKDLGHFDFCSHLLQCLEADAASIVGLSFELWLCILLLVLLTGYSPWTGPIFLLVASALLLLTNLALVVIVRLSCRGSAAGSTTGGWPARWWSHPKLLKVPIRVVLFLASFVFSSGLGLGHGRAKTGQHSPSARCGQPGHRGTSSHPPPVSWSAMKPRSRLEGGTLLGCWLKDV